MRHILVIFSTYMLAVGSLSACGGSIGPAGPQGIQGLQGAKGYTGAPGPTGGGFSTVFACGKTSGGLFFEFTGVTLLTGDVMVSCVVSGPSVQASASQFYKAGDLGTSSFLCDVVWDSDATPSGGFWKFTDNSGVFQTQYQDSGSGLNNTVVSYANSDCVFNNN